MSQNEVIPSLVTDRSPSPMSVHESEIPRPRQYLSRHLQQRRIKSPPWGYKHQFAPLRLWIYEKLTRYRPRKPPQPPTVHDECALQFIQPTRMLSVRTVSQLRFLESCSSTFYLRVAFIIPRRSCDLVNPCYTNKRLCLENTRVDVRRKISQWAGSKDQQCRFSLRVLRVGVSDRLKDSRSWLLDWDLN